MVYTCRKISTQREKPKIVETRQFKHFNSRAFENDLNQAFAGKMFTILMTQMRFGMYGKLYRVHVPKKRKLLKSPITI
jgi:hypothetical protein